MRRTTMLVACTFSVLALCATYAAAAVVTPPPADTLKVDYFSNANTAGAQDGTLRLTNPGTNNATDICAAIFVFDPNQELTECCSCVLSPDGLRTLSINNDLTRNPLTSVTLTTGVIEIVSTRLQGSICPPTSLNPTPGVRAWGTHIQNGKFSVTETASQDATLSAAEVVRVENECSAIVIDGSGFGICNCGTGD